MAGKENIGPALAAASSAWAKTLHPRPSEEEACAWMSRVFNKSRHLCRAPVCPRVCPRSPDHDAPPPPPAWGGPPPPPLSPGDQAVADRVFAELRAYFSQPVDIEPIVAPSTPAPVLSVPAWSPPTRVSEDNARTKSAYPPCRGCGQIRPIMLVMAATNLEPAGTLCSYCYRGDPRPTSTETSHGAT